MHSFLSHWIPISHCNRGLSRCKTGSISLEGIHTVVKIFLWEKNVAFLGRSWWLSNHFRCSIEMADIDQGWQCKSFRLLFVVFDWLFSLILREKYWLVLNCWSIRKASFVLSDLKNYRASCLLYLLFLGLFFFNVWRIFADFFSWWKIAHKLWRLLLTLNTTWSW